jgi:acetyl-CoA C-acetyltransferase
MEGRTRFDGDKPVNTSGGRTSFGHAHAASGLSDVYEAVKQLRGEAGDHQINKQPHTVLLRGYGGGQNFTANILRNSG